jgi:hypothetical protein
MRFVAKHGSDFVHSAYAGRVERYLQENLRNPDLIPVEVWRGPYFEDEQQRWIADGYRFVDLDRKEG